MVYLHWIAIRGGDLISFASITRRPRLLRLPAGAIEISQIWRWLVLAGRRQLSVGAQHVVLLADLYMVVGFGADDLAPRGLALGLATVALGDDPRAGERVVGHRDLVVEDVGISLVEVDPLGDDGFVVLVQRNAAVIVGAGSLEAARLDREHVVAAVSVRIGPCANGIAYVGWLDLGGPTASIGIDA